MPAGVAQRPHCHHEQHLHCNCVAAQRDQQQYKEWATIICDIVRKWSNARRLKFEREFYWLHVLRRKSDQAADVVVGGPPTGAMAAGVHNNGDKTDPHVQMHMRMNDLELHLLGVAEMLEARADSPCADA